jgi:multiple sugar transport system substrate-binding protein
MKKISPKQRENLKKILLFGGILLFVVMAVIVNFYALIKSQTGDGKTTVIRNNAVKGDKKKLAYAVHWSDYQLNGMYEGSTLKSKGLKHYLQEYTEIHPEIEFELKEIPFSEYEGKLRALYQSGAGPDIYQIYSVWGASYVKDGLFDKPPADIQKDVKENYISTAGVTMGDEIWGIPTEINDYALIYNKRLLREAGYTTPPRTWKELVDISVKTTQRDAQGNITQYGIAFIPGDEGQVVDTFLSLLFRNGGQYLSADNKKALFNNSVGVSTLEQMGELFKKGATDQRGNYWDFTNKKVAMGFAVPWHKNRIQEGFGADFDKEVGIAPLPRTKTSATLEYSLFMGVMSSSQNKKEAWEFLKWLSSDIQPTTGTTRYGDLLATTIGTLPSRKVDIENHDAVLQDNFTKVFVDELKNTVGEPHVAGSSHIRKILFKEIEAALAGTKTAKQALDIAATEVNEFLAENEK